MKKRWLKEWPWDVLREMSPVKAHAFRSVVGHYIAGTVGDEELDHVLINGLD